MRFQRYALSTIQKTSHCVLYVSLNHCVGLPNYLNERLVLAQARRGAEDIAGTEDPGSNPARV
jgi:hypothetical protein